MTERHGISRGLTNYGDQDFARAAVLKNRAEFEGKNVVVIASGGNVDQDVFALALRHLNSSPGVAWACRHAESLGRSICPA